MQTPVFTTNVYTKDAIEVFKRTFIWISQQKTSSYRRSPNRGLHNEVDISQRPDGMVIIKSNNTWNSRLRMFANDNDFHRWFAYKIKSMCYSLYGKEFWDRRNDVEVDFMSDPDARWYPRPKFCVPYSTFYFLYEALLERKGFRGKYSDNVVNRIGGVENDPIMTQAEQQRRDDLAELDAEYTRQRIEIEHKRYVEVEDCKNAIMEKYKTTLDELKAKYEADRKALEDLKFTD